MMIIVFDYLLLLFDIIVCCYSYMLLLCIYNYWTIISVIIFVIAMRRKGVWRGVGGKERRGRDRKGNGDEMEMGDGKRIEENRIT